MPNWENMNRHKTGTSVGLPQDLRNKLYAYAADHKLEITEVIRMALHQKIVRDIEAGLLTIPKEK